MINKLHSKSALTLIELIIASILVGVVTLGLIAAEQAIRTSRQSSSRDNNVSSQIQAAMLRITKDANLTVGDAVDTGIYQYAVGNDLTICFRQANGNANVYTDDLWNCWWANKTDGLLTSCNNNASPVNTCTGQPWGKLAFDATTIPPYTSFFSVIDINGDVVVPASATILNTKISYIQITLMSRYDPLSAAHPISNPDYRLTANISPPGLSR